MTHYIQLEDRETFALTPKEPGLLAEVRQGGVWVTQEGDSNDYLLRPGDVFRTVRQGRVVMQALGSAVLALPSHISQKRPASPFPPLARLTHARPERSSI